MLPERGLGDGHRLQDTLPTCVRLSNKDDREAWAFSVNAASRAAPAITLPTRQPGSAARHAGSEPPFSSEFTHPFPGLFPVHLHSPQPGWMRSLPAGLLRSEEDLAHRRSVPAAPRRCPPCPGRATPHQPGKRHLPPDQPQSLSPSQGPQEPRHAPPHFCFCTSGSKAPSEASAGPCGTPAAGLP